MRFRFVAPVCVMAFIFCSENAVTTATVNEVVVDGCLIAGARIDSIRVSPLLPYGGDAASMQPIIDAAITLSDGTVDRALVAFGDSGYYRCADSLFLPQEGKTYTISFTYGGKNISASAIVPETPSGMALSTDTLPIDTTISTFEMIRQQRESGTIPTILLMFKNPAAAYFYVVVQNVDSAPVALNSDTSQFRGTRFLSSPFQDTSYAITFAHIKALGKHRVTLYRVDQEYVDLYNNRTQDSRNLNEPKTDVVGGLGIFTAANCDSVFFYAVAK